jgi:MFS family permease
MSRDLGFTDRVYGFGAGIFFLSYVALQVPGAMLVERWSARRMVTITLVLWGSMTVLTALVHTPMQLYVARFLLGAAEAGFFPGVIVYLSHWFIREDRAKATANFMAAIPFSFVIGSPLSGWLLGRSWLEIPGWRWLFILEGLPAVICGVVAWFYLTDQPGQAKWLDAEQRGWLEEKLKSERATVVRAESIGKALKSRVILLLAATCFFFYFSGYSFSFWLPTILKRQTGLSDLDVGLLGSLPYMALFVAMQFNGWHSDRKHERGWHAATPQIIAAGALLVLAMRPGPMPLSIALFAIAACGTAYLPAFWAMPTEYLSASAAAAAVGLINAVGSVAGFAGPYLFGYLNTVTGSFATGLIGMALTALAGAALVLRVIARPPAETAPSNAPPRNPASS